MSHLTYKAYTEQNKPTDFTFSMEGAGCCIIIHKKVLLLQRSTSHKWQAGTWGIPAGKLEAGETPEHAAIRETQEEAGIILAPESLFYQGHIYFTVGTENPLNYRFHVYTAYLQELPSVTLEPDQVAFRWVAFDEALQLPVFTGTQEVFALGMNAHSTTHKRDHHVP